MMVQELIADQLPTPPRQLYDPDYLEENDSEHDDTEPPVEGHRVTEVRGADLAEIVPQPQQPRRSARPTVPNKSEDHYYY